MTNTVSDAELKRVGDLIIGAANIPEQAAYRLAREILVLTTAPKPVVTEEMRVAFHEQVEVTREGSIRNLDAGLIAALELTTQPTSVAGEKKCAICNGPHDNDLCSDICTHCEADTPWRESLASTTQPANPVGDGVEVVTPFITSNSGGGEYFVKVKVSSIAELHQAHDRIMTCFSAPLKNDDVKPVRCNNSDCWLPDERYVSFTDHQQTVDGLRAALKPFANAIFNDNGDVTFDYTMFNDDDLFRAYSVLKRAALSSNGGK